MSATKTQRIARITRRGVSIKDGEHASHNWMNWPSSYSVDCLSSVAHPADWSNLFRGMLGRLLNSATREAHTLIFSLFTRVNRDRQPVQSSKTNRYRRTSPTTIRAINDLGPVISARDSSIYAKSEITAFPEFARLETRVGLLTGQLSAQLATAELSL